MLLWMDENFPDLGLASNRVGRVELSKRQDWSLEVSSKIYPLLGPTNAYLVDSIVLGQNILRDSTLQRMECNYFEAYVHVNAVMWEVAFAELRYLTNSKTVSLNPMEVNDLYDRLWRMATQMQGPDALDILEAVYRPWPRLQPSNEALSKWYDTKRDSKEHNLEALRAFYGREDRVEYEQVFRSLLALFGKAIHDAFERNLSDRLESTNGEFSNSKLSASDVERKKNLMCHNNAAERTFAVFRSMLNRYPSMSLRHAATISFSRLNGTFRQQVTNGAGEIVVEGGAAVLADVDLQNVVSDLCSVREGNQGYVTMARRAAHDSDKAAGNESRKRKRDELKAKEIEKARKKAAKANQASEVILATSHRALLDGVAACGGKVTSAKVYLKEQISARPQMGHEYPITTVPVKFRTDTSKKKIRLTKPKGLEGDEVKYLQDLAVLMVKHDSNCAPSSERIDVQLVREVPLLSKKHTSMRSIKLREGLQKKVEALTAPEDDPLLLQLLKKYKGQLLLVYDARPKQTYRVLDVQLYEGKGGSCWEATCVPVESGGKGGWRIPK